MINISVNTREAALEESETLTGGSAGIQCRFSFSEDWEGLTRIAIFRAGDEGSQYEVPVDETGVVTVPAEALAKENEGEPLMIGAYGGNGLTVAVPTVWVSAGAILPGAVPAAPVPEPEPEPEEP